MRLRRDRRGRGQALVEFALVIPIFLLLLVAIFDMGRAVFAYNTLTNAAREGARMAIVNQYKPSVLAHAKSETAIVELDDPSVSVTYWQVVTFEATYHPITPIIANIIFGSGVTFTATAQLPVEFSCPPDLTAGTVAADALLCPKQP